MIGEEIQKLSVIQNIPELLKEDYEGCLSKIIPKMNQGLVQGSIEYHLAASKSVQKILKQNTIQPVHFKVNFLKTVLKSMDNRDPDTAKTWLDTLLEAIKILKEDVIIEDILPVAEAKSRHTEPVFHRVMSCRMLGRIAEFCSTYTVQKSVLGIVQALCQDVDKSVRAAMCFQLPQLTRPLLASYDRDLLPLLNDCVNDEQIEVRASAYCALVQSLALVNQDILKQSFLPMAKKIIEQCLQTVQDGIFLIDLTEQYGNLCLGLESIMNEQDKIWFAEAYLKLADLASSVQMKFKERVMDRGRMHAQSRSPHNSSIFVDSRVNCALNMPYIIRFCRGIGNSNAAYFTRNIYPLMCMLCSDSQYAVRRAIASVMHEIAAATLGKANGFIQKEFIKLLNDDSEDVLQALIPNIKKCLECFCESENFSPDVVDDKSIELTRSLFACESEVLATYNWRLQTEFFKQLEVLMRCLPSSFVYSQFVQLLRKRLFTYRTVECRVAIVRTLLVFLRYNTNMSQRNDLRNSIITDLCCSKNFYNRSIYVRSIPNILEIFSSAYFRAHFFSPTIALMEDKVANIRFMMCDLMPMLKCIAAHDKNNGKYSALVDAAIEKTNSERDRLVLEHVATMNKMLDKAKLDERDSAKIKEEKILDAIAANAKDVKSHFASLNTRSVPLRNPPRTFDVRDVRSLSSRSLDSRNGDSTHIQQQLTLDCTTPVSNQTPSPAGTASSQLSPDIISYDIFSKFHQTYSNNNGAATNNLASKSNFQNFDKIPFIDTVRSDLVPNPSFQNFDQVPYNDDARNDFVLNSSFQTFDQIPSCEAARSNLAPKSNFQNYYQFTSNETAGNDSPPISNFQNVYQFPSHEADRNNDIIPKLNFPSFNHVPCAEAAGNDLISNLNSPNLDQVPLNNHGSSKNDLTQNLSRVLSDGEARNDLTQNLIGISSSGIARNDLAQNLNFQNFNPISSNVTVRNESVTNSNFTNSNQIPIIQVAGNDSTQNSNLNQIPTNDITRNDDFLSSPNARCMSPDIIRNSKSSLLGNLPDIALNHSANSSELLVKNVGLEGIEGESHENYNSNTGYVIENSSIVYLEDGFSVRPDEKNDSKNDLLSKHGSPDQSNETKHFFAENPSLGYVGERISDTNDTINSIMDGKSSTEFLERFSNQNKKINKFVRNPSMMYLDESFDHKAYDSRYDSHQKHETCHTHEGKRFETPSSMYLENNQSRNNETFDSNNVYIIEGEATINPPDNEFLSLDKTFESRRDVQNLNQNHNTSRYSRKFKINSSNLLNNNFETTAPATYTYSYINENPTASTLSDNLKIDTSNLQNNNLETSMSIYNSNEIQTETLSDRIDDNNFDSRLKLGSCSIFINESPLNETISDIRNLQFERDLIENNSLIVNMDENISLGSNETIMLQTNNAHESCSSLILQNNFPDNLGSKNAMSAKILAENITSENGSRETVLELHQNCSDSKVSVQSTKESYLHTTGIPKVLDNELNLDNKTENNTFKQISHVSSVESNHVISEVSSLVPNLDNNVESIVPSKSENIVIEKEQIKTDQNSLKKGDILSIDHHKVPDVNKSPIKISKNNSSGIPTISKSPRRSLALDSECTSHKTSIPSMNARRSLVFDSGCTPDQTSIPSTKKSQRNSLNFDCEYASENVSNKNESPKSSLVFGNDHNDPNISAKNIISKLDSINCFGIVKSLRSNDKTKLGSQKAAESRNPKNNESPNESPVFKRSNDKTTSQACLQKTGELRKSSQCLVSKRSVDKTFDGSSQSSDNSRKSSETPVSKLLNKKTTGESTDEVKEYIKPKRLSGKTSEKCLQTVDEPNKTSKSHVSKPFNDKISEDEFQKVEEHKKPSKISFSKLATGKMSEDTSLYVDESENYSESHVSRMSTNKISDADSLKVDESKKLLKTPSSKLETYKMSEKSNIKKPESPQKSSQNPVSKPSSAQAPQKSFLPIRASKNVEITSGESQVTINSKRHSLGTLSTDNDVVISKQMTRKGAGRPQSLVINSSRLPVRSGISSTSSLGISRSPR